MKRPRNWLLSRSLQSNSFYDIDDDMKCQLVKRLLEKYFDNEDLTYYMNAFKREAKALQGHLDPGHSGYSRKGKPAEVPRCQQELPAQEPEGFRV